jgi:hypothetical protein
MLEQCKVPEKLQGCRCAMGVTAGPTKLATEGNWSWTAKVRKTPKLAFMTPAPPNGDPSTQQGYTE